MYIVSQKDNLILNSKHVSNYRINGTSIEAYVGDDDLPYILGEYKNIEITARIFKELLNALVEMSIFSMPQSWQRSSY